MNKEHETVKQFLDVLDDIPITLHLKGTYAAYLLGNLVLSLQHPQNDGPTSDVVKAIARSMVDGLRFQCEVKGHRFEGVLVDEWKAAFYE